MPCPSFSLKHIHFFVFDIGHINQGLEKPSVLVEDESSDSVILDTVGNNESELGGTSALNLNNNRKLQQNLVCTLCSNYSHMI